MDMEEIYKQVKAELRTYRHDVRIETIKRVIADALSHNRLPLSETGQDIWNAYLKVTGHQK